MIVVDVNLLLYAAVDGFPQHVPAHDWWVGTLNSPNAVGLAEPSMFGFLRLSTNARLIDRALTARQAVGLVRGWLDQPNVEFLTPGARHLDIAFGLLEAVGTAGNLTSDVRLAAYAIENDAELCSNDSDFARFADLRWVNPLADGS